MAGTKTLTLDMLAINVADDDPSDVRRAQTGDEVAFGRIVAEHQSLVLRTAWRLVGHREDARDIAQEVFLRLHRHIDRLAPDRDVAPWLYRVTVNLGLTALRRRRRKPESVLDDEGHTIALSAGRPEQERRGEAADARRVLASVFDRLSEKERAAVVLRDLEGLDVAEVAKALRCRRGTVRTHLSRGRLKLRKALEAQGGRS
jgi:RNA polymerase sigma-70 factor (ECF subfamily)